MMAVHGAEANALLIGDHHLSTQVDADNLGGQGQTLCKRRFRCDRATLASAYAGTSEILAESSRYSAPAA